VAGYACAHGRDAVRRGVRVAEPLTGRRGRCAGLELGELGFMFCHCCCVELGFGWLLLWCLGFSLLWHCGSSGNERQRLQGAHKPGFNSDRTEQGTEELGTNIPGTT
jgi:hypothetical protein